MLWTLPLLPMLLGPVKQPLVDFDTKAATLDVVLQKLSAQTGTSLKATPHVAREVVFVSVRGVSLEDLKARLADSVEAKWVRDGASEYLRREPAQERAIFQRHVALRRKYVDDELPRLAKSVETPFDAKSLADGLSSLPSAEEVGSNPALARRRYEQERSLFAKSPAARLTTRLILACDPNDLAAVGPYQRVIFRLQPTGAQKGFNAQRFQSAMAEFAREQAAWKEAAALANFKEDRNGRTVSDPRAQTDLASTADSIYGIEIRRGDAAGLFNVNLIGAKGPFGRGILGQTFVADPSRRFLDAMMDAPLPGATDPEVKLDPASMALKSYMLGAFMGGKPEPMTAELREILLNPDKHEPLSFGASEILVAYAADKKVNLVASLPDSVYGVTWMASQQGPVKLNQSMRALVQSGSVELNEKDGWGVIRPADRYEANLGYTPRSAIKSLLKNVVAKGRLDIRDYAKYAFDSGRFFRVGLGEYYLMLWDRSNSSGFDRTDWEGLRLYGSFNEVQQKGLENGARFPFGAMTPQQKSIVERITYAGEIRSERQAGEGSSHMNTAPVEPTERFPNGIPNDGFASARVQSVPMLVAYGKGPDGKIRPLRSLNVWTLASIEVDVLGDASRMNSYGITGLVGYAPGAEKMIALRVELAPSIWKEMPITVSDFDPNAKPVSWDKLPEPYAKQIKDAIDQVRAQKQNQPGRTIPPKP